MTAGVLESPERRISPFLKASAYIMSYLISLGVAICAAAVATVITYRLSFYNDEISFRVFLTVVPLVFVLLAWLAAPRMARLLLMNLRRHR
ncbi:MAG: hypothetical protein A3F83_01725 [Candidatus Glassbacteria bacterium RIFCSPLOWO2_12_FULL_58_11]|uniref:Uncharacterized protein n=1 Tax=Candidatus Glassbacteria bacterium RIFCSPLOWO2_12_FULL_58_11 TaxID=1817867 RepID=A0A1F5YL20_9BACT|nr:MAG: hypothetical protein A3F83_01725 [Candidatus Glassbacteria bacterium RIFCSPLOWO2_12_FULL_58_11]